jgi:hypothetical protein
MCLSFTIAAGHRQRIHSRVESLGTRDHTLLSQTRDVPFCPLLRLAGIRPRLPTGEEVEFETITSPAFITWRRT